MHNFVHNPEILVSEAWTATLLADNSKEDQNFRKTPTFAERQKEQQAMNLNRLKDKNAWYQSHREFLLQCIESKLIPKGLKLELQPTIGNHNQDFLDTWYFNLQDFSLTLMKGIIKFREETISETAAHINSIEKALKQNMEKDECQKIKETISRNEEATKQVLKQSKFKMFNYLKQKPDTEKNKKKITNHSNTLHPEANIWKHFKE